MEKCTGMGNDDADKLNRFLLSILADFDRSYLETNGKWKFKNETHSDSVFSPFR